MILFLAEEADINKHRFRFLLVWFVLILVCPACEVSSPDDSTGLIGTWQGFYGHTLIITFGADGRFEGTVISGTTTVGTYTVDASTTPIQLDQTVDGSDILLMTIIEFIDKDTLLMEFNAPDAPRPSSFSDFSIELHRVTP